MKSSKGLNVNIRISMKDSQVAVYWQSLCCKYILKWNFGLFYFNIF